MAIRLVMLATLLGGALVVRPAAACIPPPCWPASTIPPGAATVPANVPALGFTLGRTGGAFSGDAMGFQLLDPDGKAVSLTFEATSSPPAGNYLVRPKEPLQPDRTYQVRYPEGCPNLHPKTPPDVVEWPLHTGPAIPIPTSIGTVTVTGHRVAEAPVGYYIGACVLTPLRAGLTHVQIHATPEFQAYLPLGNVSATIDGRSAPVVNYQQPGPAAAIEMDLYAHCAGDAGMSGGLASGKYQVQFEAWLLGITPLPPPLTATIELSCDDSVRPDAAPDLAADTRSSADTTAPGDTAVAGDAARADGGPGDAGPDVAAADDAAPPSGDSGVPADAAAVSPGTRGCGCALGARSADGTLGLLLAASVWLRRWARVARARRQRSAS